MEEKTQTPTFCWNELNTSDPAAALKFYTELFGWTTKPFAAGDMNYTIIEADGVGIGGIMSMPDYPTFWGAYVVVKDVDQLAEKIVALGGRLLREPHDVPTIGRLLHFEDPQGARISAITPAPRE